MAEGLDGRVVGVVLARGEGKRLRPLTYYFQKCMIPVGSLQKPLLEYILLALRRHGIADVKLLVGYKHEQIVNYFNSGSRLGMDVEYFVDDPCLGGSGGALLNAARQGTFRGVDCLLVYYGDILSSIDLSSMLRQYVEANAAATPAVARGFEVPVGVAELEGREVKRWVEKPRIDICAGIGIMALSQIALDGLEELGKRCKDVDIMGDLVPHLIRGGRGVEAYVTDAFWYDVGSAEKYEKLENHVVDGLLESEKFSVI